MTPAYQFKRYLWLVATLYRRGPMTREEIDRAWTYSSDNDYKSSIFDTNYSRMLDGVRSIFDVDIRCNRATNQYYIATSLEKNDYVRWLIETMAFANFVMESKDLQKQILVEDMPSDAFYLKPIADAMRKHLALKMTYQNFFDESPSTFEFEPYCLKTFRRRWYVLGRSSNQTNLRTYSLDRLSEVIVTDKSYTIPDGFNAEEYFRGYYGVLNNERPTTIRLWTTSLRAKYLRSLPLHHSQKEVECVAETSPQKNDGHSVFELYMAPTFDFIQELRSLAAEVKVLEPTHLADCLRYDAEQVLKMYNDK